jgi:hypothetical protein
MARRRDLRRCPRCGLDIGTGEDGRSSRWGGASLPSVLDVYCDTCRLSFFTCKANRPAEHRTVRAQAPELLSMR